MVEGEAEVVSVSRREVGWYAADRDGSAVASCAKKPVRRGSDVDAGDALLAGASSGGSSGGGGGGGCGTGTGTGAGDVGGVAAAAAATVPANGSEGAPAPTSAACAPAARMSRMDRLHSGHVVDVSNQCDTHS
jgi:hypothetical protein